MRDRLKVIYKWLLWSEENWDQRTEQISDYLTFFLYMLPLEFVLVHFQYVFHVMQKMC